MSLKRSITSLLCLCRLVTFLASALELTKIDYITPHEEVAEGEAVHLQCLVTALQPGYSVIWQRRIISASGNVVQEKLATNGHVETSFGRVLTSVKQHRAGTKAIKLFCSYTL